MLAKKDKKYKVSMIIKIIFLAYSTGKQKTQIKQQNNLNLVKKLRFPNPSLYSLN